MTKVSPAFPIVDQLHAAGDTPTRARILLRLSDEVVSYGAGPLQDACASLGFFEGQCFVALRAALICRSRDQDGLLPVEPASELERLRLRLVAIGAGEGGRAT